MNEYISLMYHAVYDGEEELQAIPKEERPYAISAQTFRSQMALLKETGLPVSVGDEQFGPEADRGVQLTFDDGDRGWFRHALPVLLENDFQAIFFVTTDLIEDRSDFCSWPEIRALAEQGMTVQSHGKTHKFLSDMTQEECREEFRVSKQKLEEITGQNVDKISFPGGRFNSSSTHIGVQEGYRHFFTSEVGVNKPEQTSAEATLIKRIALRNSTSLEEFGRLIRNEGHVISKQVASSKLKQLAKNTLGNSNYDRLYRLFKG